MLARLAIEFVLIPAVLAKMATEFALMSDAIFVILSAFVLMLALRPYISFSNSVILLSKSESMSSFSGGV